MRPVLMLWDVDQTLIDPGSAGREAYIAAFEALTGQALKTHISTPGATEEAILRNTLALNPVKRTFTFADFYRAHSRTAVALKSRVREVGHCMPGAKAAIKAFADIGITQSLVTGNIRSIAAAKLEAFALTTHIDFSIGGYGDDGIERAVLVRTAIERASSKYRIDFQPHQVVVIGDTPLDLQAALDSGARAIGVATGDSSAAALRDAGASTVLPNLTDITALRQALNELSI